MVDYYKHLKNLSQEFTRYVAEALGLAPDAFESLFEPEVSKRHLRCKLLRYPVCPPSTTGFVAHTDSNFLSYVSAPDLLTDESANVIVARQLLQPSAERGLEFQKPSGEWFSAPPIQGTFIVLIGSGARRLFVSDRGLTWFLGQCWKGLHMSF
jgi:isopenicillin N synthase-like dioxygenase